MSWEVDGVSYHDRAAYERARRERETRVALQEMASLQQRHSALQQRVARTESELAGVRDDIEAQTRLTECLSHDVDEMRHVQQQLETSQAELERELDRQAGELRRALGQAREEIARLDLEHQAHVADVREQFCKTRRELEAGLQRAEERRARTEAELRRAVGEVDRKLEADLARRAAERNDQRETARLRLQAAETLLARNQEAHERLDLVEKVQTVREQILQARSLIEAGHPSAALGLSQAAFAEALSVGHATRRRTARLDVARASVIERAGQARKMLEEPGVRRYFGREAGLVERRLDERERQAAARYVRYARVEVEACEDERQLTDLEEKVSAMTAALPILKELSVQRKAECDRILELLAGIHGPLSHVEHSFALPGDPKSELVMRCRFGGENVLVTMDIAGGFKIDGSAYGSDSRCARVAQDVVDRIARDRLVTRERAGGSDRPGPVLTPAGITGTLGVLRSRLSDLERGGQ